MKYLMKHDSINDFLDWIYEIREYYWQIRDEDIIKRKNSIKDTTYFKKLNDLASKQEIDFDDTEIISWLDSIAIMQEVFNDFLNRKNKDLNNMNIVQELHIPFTNKRADLVLFKDNKILIIEFSFAKWDIEYRYEHKLNQAIGYKECLENILPSHIEIATHTFIIQPEDNNYEMFPKNNKSINNLKSYIEYFFSNTKKDSFTELSKIK